MADSRLGASSEAGPDPALTGKGVARVESAGVKAADTFASLSSTEEVVDFGIAALDVPLVAAEIQEFAPPSAPKAVVAKSTTRQPPRVALVALPQVPSTATAPAEPIFIAPEREASKATEPVELEFEPRPTEVNSLVLPESARARSREVGFLGVVWDTVRWAAGGVLWFIQSLFGIAAMIFALAVVASIPVLNLLALGYLLEVEGRVGRSGKLRDAFHLVPTVAPRLGAIILGTWLCLWPLRLLTTTANDARIIEAGSFADRGLHLAMPLVIGLTIAHITLAIASGGSLASFLFPPIYAVKLYRKYREGNFWARAETAVSEFVRGFQFPHLLWLGLRGYVGAFLWLVIPTALFASARKAEGLPILVTLVGGFLLVIVLSWVPFLQAHFAAEGRFKAMFELGTVRLLFRKSPLMWLLSITLTLAIALPLYLGKVVIPPADGVWLLTPLYIVTIYPMKVLTGWAYHRATVRTKNAFFLWRWFCWLLMVPVLAFFVFILFFTQFIGEHGKGVLFEYHAFLLPSPF